MDDRIAKVIEREYLPESNIKVRYEDDDIIMWSFTNGFGDDMRAVPKAKDKIDTLWIYGSNIYKLEGGDLATIRDKLVSVPRGFLPYNDKIILSTGHLFRDGVFLFISCSSKAFYLPNTKVTEYITPDSEEALENYYRLFPNERKTSVTDKFDKVKI